MPKGVPKRTYDVIVEQDAILHHVSSRDALSSYSGASPVPVHMTAAERVQEVSLQSFARPPRKSSVGLALREKARQDIVFAAKRPDPPPKQPPQAFVVLPSQLNTEPDERFTLTGDSLLPDLGSSLGSSGRRSATPRLSSSPRMSSSPRFSSRKPSQISPSASSAASVRLSRQEGPSVTIVDRSQVRSATPGGSDRNSHHDTMSNMSARGSPDSVSFEFSRYADFKSNQFGRQGLSQQCSMTLWRARTQVREMHQRMMLSMTRSFPGEIWDACDVPRPEGDEFDRDLDPDAHTMLEVEQAKMTKATKAEEVNKKFIKTDRDADRHRDHLQEQRQIALLAKESGWSVLDVEEFHDAFQEFATDGVICLGSEACEKLIGRIYDGVQKEEICNFITRHRRHERHAANKPTNSKLRKRPTVGHMHHRHTRLAALRQQDESDSDEELGNTLLNFQEFYFAFVRWLRQVGNTEVRKRCTLTRFSKVSKKQGTNTVSEHEAPAMMSMDSDEEGSEDANSSSTQTSDSEVHSIGGDDDHHDQDDQEDHDNQEDHDKSHSVISISEVSDLDFSRVKFGEGGSFLKPGSFLDTQSAGNTPRSSHFLGLNPGAGSCESAGNTPRGSHINPRRSTAQALPKGLQLMFFPTSDD